jgi:hypothetical protein
MFLLRSAFWLTVMFLIIAPRNYDLGKDVANASQEALEAGQKAIVAQILASDCTSLECAGGKAALSVLAGNKLPSIDMPMQDTSTIPVPLPRPRPDRMG